MLRDTTSVGSFPWPTKVPIPTGEFFPIYHSALGTLVSDLHIILCRCAAISSAGCGWSFALFVSVAGPFRSQWFITFKPAPNLDKKHTVFGNLVGGDEVLDALEKLAVKPGTERPAKPVRITDIVVFVDTHSFDR